MLLPPLFEEVTERDVYLPRPNGSIYQTGKTYEKGWNRINCRKDPVGCLFAKELLFLISNSLSQPGKWIGPTLDLVVFASAVNKAERKGLPASG
jgi:hypothetical protein